MNRIFAILLMFFTSLVLAKGVYLTNSAYIEQQLGELPKVQALWLTDDDKQQIAAILQRQYNQLRIKYWQGGDKTVFVFDEIGKEQPITIGITVQQLQITDVSVLAYRESRGDEVRHDFFTQQFKSSKLDGNFQLTQSIDGITGATLSVRALTKSARLALFLSSKIAVNAKS